MVNSNSSHDSKREKEAVIFDAACKVIRSKGFHHARITDIAQAAGISYGLVYHYFRSKADLFEAIQKEWWENLLKMMDLSEQKSATSEEKTVGNRALLPGRVRKTVGHGAHFYHGDFPGFLEFDAGQDGMVQDIHVSNRENHGRCAV